MRFMLFLKIFIGFVALTLGAAGLFIPVWPTTPFVLLAVGCFSSTPRIKRQVLRIGFFREYYDAYTQGQQLRKSTVVVSILFLWSMLVLSMIFSGSIFVGILLFVVGLAVTIHILMVAKLKKSDNAVRERENNGD